MPTIFSQMTCRQSSGYRRPRDASRGGRLLGLKFWKNLSLLVAFPAIGVCMANAFLAQMYEEEQSRPPFIKYEYMYKREKRFPWGAGNKSLFHNSNVNALPDGYEHEH